MPNQIALDPVLPTAFDATPNESRSKAQLDAWWDHPFGITLPDGRIEVRCLNGGAWDRSTHFGIAESYEAACELAEAKQAEWVRLRARPTLSLDAGQVMVVRMPQRPDEAAAARDVPLHGGGERLYKRQLPRSVTTIVAARGEDAGRAGARLARGSSPKGRAPLWRCKEGVFVRTKLTGRASAHPTDRCR